MRRAEKYAPRGILRLELFTSYFIQAMFAESLRQRTAERDAWRAEKLELERLLASSRAECAAQAALLVERTTGKKTECDFTPLSSAFEF
jgi:hypothetical protein